MTDPVSGVSGTTETSAGGTYSGGAFSEERKKRKSEVQGKDLVEISQDARDRLSGRKRKTILEYIADFFD